MDETIGIALVLTLIVAAITGASFVQGVGVFIVMFFAAAAFVSMTYEKSARKSTNGKDIIPNEYSSDHTEDSQEKQRISDTEDQATLFLDSHEPRRFSSAINVEVPAMHALYTAGERYFYGKDGVDQDYAKAAACFTRSADQGYIHAYRMMGLMYAQGKGVPLDYVKAIECYALAKAHSHSPIEREIKRLKGLLTPSQVDQLNRIEIEWGSGKPKPQILSTKPASPNPDAINTAVDTVFGELDRLAKGGDAEAQVRLGEMYYSGTDIPQDYRRAAVLFLKAARGGNPDAQLYLGTMCDNGQGMPRNSLKAMEWYVKAAENGNQMAQEILSTRIANT